MPKREFKPTKGLVEDVMTKQAGSLEKAVLEGIMNLVDAGASWGDIHLENGYLTIEDDGSGMSEDEVEEFFSNFGKKEEYEEEKTFGRFHMGRGQIFSFGVNIWRTQNNVMVVNLNDDETTVELPNVPEQDDESIIERDGDKVTLDTSGLSYAWLESDNNVDGCSIKVELYDTVGSVNGKVKDIKDIAKFVPWVNNVQLTINGEDIIPDGVENHNIHETDEAYFFLRRDRFGSKTSIYNQGAYVKDESITKSQGTIITKVDLDVNFARNSILTGDSNWDKIVEDYEQFTVNRLLEKKSLYKREKRWLLEMAADSQDVYNRIREYPMIEDVNGNEVSLSTLEGREVAFAPSGNKQAQDAQEETNTVLVDSTYSGSMLALAEDKADEVKEYTQVVKNEMRWEMDEFDYAELSKRRRQNFDRAEWFLRELGWEDDIKPGYSRYADAWINERGTLYIGKGLLNKNKQTFILQNLIKIIEVAAHETDTREGLNHSYTFQENLWDYVGEMGELQEQLLNNNAP